ncbi:MAG: hypothetical protein AAFP08_02835 [Bacteroidota bacterium]
MITHLRQAYNGAFKQSSHDALLAWLSEQAGVAPKFQVSETPVFIPAYLKARLLEAGKDIIDVVTSERFFEHAPGAIPSGQAVPGRTPHPLFLQMDFGLCMDDEGKVIPQLVEAQGFPSLYFFQDVLAAGYREFFDIPEHFTSRFGGLSVEDYHRILADCILDGEDPEEVVLLEVEPDKQTTQIDFELAQKQLGLQVLCISEVERKGDKLYYTKDGRQVRIKRIFNRVIFDELLKRTDFDLSFHMTEEVDVSWAGHPDWFAMLSKHTLPLFDSPYVPKSYFLKDVLGDKDQSDAHTSSTRSGNGSFVEAIDLRKYVLKPLYSFAGQGINLNPTLEDLKAVPDPENYILQQKVTYEPLVDTLDIPAKAEVRMMYLWPPGEAAPMLINNLVRLSKGEMVGVRYNKGKTWVGGSIGYFE